MNIPISRSMDALQQREGDSQITVVKLGTAVLSNEDKTKLDYETIRNIGDDIVLLNGVDNTHAGESTIGSAGTPLSTVIVASGAVTAGIERLGWGREEVDADIDLKRVASMAGNSALFSALEQATGFIAASDLPTHNDLDSEESWDHLKRALLLSLKRGLLPILNEGDARSSEELEEIIESNGSTFKRFGDNDWLAAHAAVQLGARRLVFLTTKDGICADVSDPKSIVHDLAADRISDFIGNHVDDSDTSNGGMESKLRAAQFALEHGVEAVAIGNGKTPGMATLAGTNGHGTAIHR